VEIYKGLVAAEPGVDDRKAELRIMAHGRPGSRRCISI
jgi:hypothetical protein